MSSRADSCGYVYQSLSADGEIKIRINAAGENTKLARAGVMIRESLIPGAKYAFAGITGDGFFRWQSRSSTSGKTVLSSTRGGTPGAWIRLVRNGNTITSYRSYDGISWARLATATVAMAPNIYVGIAAASGSTTTPTTSKFSSPTVVP
jgi:regulation of enolase protein 1 (concanavalin A-like superfamily)